MRAAPKATAVGAADVRFALDSELADLLVLKLRRLRDQKTSLSEALRTDRELGAILEEFRRRAAAHAVAREHYRARRAQPA